MQKEDKNLKKEEEIKVGQTVWTTGTEGLQERKVKSIGTRYIYLENDNRRFNKNTLEVSGSEKELSNIVLDKKKYDIEQLKENISQKKESVKKLFDGVEKISKKILPKEVHTTNVDLLFSSLKEKMKLEGADVLELKKGALKKELKGSRPIKEWKDNIIKELVKVEPKLKKLEAYQNYKKNETQENASKFLDKAYKSANNNKVSDIYLKYVSEKPSNNRIIINANDNSIDKVKSLAQQYVSNKIDMELESKVITNLLLKQYNLEKYGFDIKSTINNISNFNNVSVEERLNKIEKTYYHVEKIVPMEREIRNKVQQDINVGDIVKVGVAAMGTAKAIEQLGVVTNKLKDGNFEVNKILDRKIDVTTVGLEGYSMKDGKLNLSKSYIDLSKSYNVKSDNIVEKVGDLSKEDLNSLKSSKELFQANKLSDPVPKSLQQEQQNANKLDNAMGIVRGIEMMQE